MFPDFKQKFINTSGATINVVTGGKGFPLLLLHGYPQTYYMWHKIAPLLAEEFTVVATDLRGYGDSSKPKGEVDHSNYSKRAMAQDQVEVMASLGFNEFFVVGHDRGARVGQRLALDYPNKVKKMILMDIVPTCKMYSHTDKLFATTYYHWFFLIQPYPLPETLISKNSDYFLKDCLMRWSNDLSAFTTEAITEYLRCFRDWNTIHATCEDYRASASIDIEHDQEIYQKIDCPLLVLWGKNGFVGNRYDLLTTWWSYGSNVRGHAIDSGHFLPEEAPEESYFAIRDFLINDFYF